MSPPGGVRAADRLIESHRSYAHALAAEVMRKLPPQVELDDVRGAAELGLVEAASAFDPARGVQFKTFAYYRIRGAIYDNLRKMGWLPRDLYKKVKAESAADEYMKDALDTPPQPVTADAAWQELADITTTVATCFVLSLESMTGEIEDPAAGSVEEQVADREQRGLVREAVRQLPDKNRQIMESYYFQEKTLDQIGAELGLSKSWVCRMHAKSLDLLRGILAGTMEATMPVQGR